MIYSNEVTGQQKGIRKVAKDKILLIEPNSADVKLIHFFLKKTDLSACEIVQAKSLETALDQLDSGEHFAAVLFNIFLPDSHGMATYELLSSRFPNNSFIVLADPATQKTGKQIVSSGAQDVLVKGNFDAESLAKTIRYALDRNNILKRLEAIQQIALIGNWEYSIAAKNFSASEEVYRIFGFPSNNASFNWEDFQDIHHPFHIFNLIHDEVEEKGEVKKDLKIQLPDGSSKFISVQCHLNRSVSGHYKVVGMLQDITEKKMAEENITTSQERYQDIFHQSKDAIFICTFEGKFVDFNQATLDLFGYTAEELTNLENPQSVYYPKERIYEFVLKIKLTKSVKDFPIKVVNKRGEIRQCLLSANVLITEDLFGYTCIVRDITERIQAEKLRKSRDLARQSAEMKEQFIASISHEMRTPMNAILGMSNLLSDMNLQEEESKLVSSIKQSSELLLGIVNDILDISAIQNQKVKFENKDFDLFELLDNLVNVMQYKAQEKDLYFEVVIGDEIPQLLRGDKLRLNQVLYNLVGNAIKFTETGYVKIFVKKLYDIPDGVQLQFLVEDTGIGIPEEKLEAIFESFTRIKYKNRLYEGTGLGLSICKNLVEQQGGKIGVTSQLGQGSRFFFDLIFEIGEEIIANESTEQVYTIDDNATFNLLLVEDHKLNQLVAKKTLCRKWKNINLVIAEHGKQAIEFLEEKPFDIILLDIQMPVMDGYETAKYIREKMPAAIANLPILAMTAHAHIARDESFKLYGMDDYVLKPFEPEALFSKIAKYLRQP